MSKVLEKKPLDFDRSPALREKKVLGAPRRPCGSVVALRRADRTAEFSSLFFQTEIRW